MKKIILSFLILINLVCPSLLMALPEATPTVSIEKTIDNVIMALNSEYPDKPTKRKAVLAEVKKIFDFQEMSKRSLGSHWTKYSSEDRSDFIDAFSDFLGNTYLGKIETVTKDMVRFDTEQIKKDKAYVKTTILVDDSKFPINYKMFTKNNQWMVYDVVIENIGLVSNYRNEFSGFLRKNSLKELTERLKKKVASQA